MTVLDIFKLFNNGYRKDLTVINFKIIFQYLKQKKLEEKIKEEEERFREKESRRKAQEQYNNLTLEEKAKREIDKCNLLIYILSLISIAVLLCVTQQYVFLGFYLFGIYLFLIPYETTNKNNKGE
jgi:hypothetical protein